MSANLNPSQRVLVESSVPEEHWSAVSSLARFLVNVSPGWRPSDAMREAVRTYEREGLEGVNSR